MVIEVNEEYFPKYMEQLGYVKVVRCKYCKHYVDECCNRYADETLGYVHSTKEYGYCDEAERRN